MIPLIILAVLAGVPVLLAMIFRVNAIYLFLSLVAGDVLVKFLSDDVSLAVAMINRSPHVPMISQLSLLLLPILLTIFFMRRSIPAAKFVVYLLPLILTGLSVPVFALPLLTSGTQGAIFATPIGNALQNVQDLIVCTAAIMTLMLVWFSNRQHHGKHGKHH